MFVPITSEVTIKTGMVLREIATEQSFVVGERMKNEKEVVWGDKWKITPTGPETADRSPVIIARQELSERYFAEV